MVFIVVVRKFLNIYFSSDATTIVPTPSKLTTTKSSGLNDCPEGWMYAGALGCLYFNTDNTKVLK